MEAYLFWLVRWCIFGSREAEPDTCINFTFGTIVLECIWLVKLLHQQQITLGQEEYVAFTIITMLYKLCIWRLSLRNNTCICWKMGNSCGFQRSSWLSFIMKNGFHDGLGRRSSNDLHTRLLSKRRCLCLFWERNYGFTVSRSKVLDFLKKSSKENI